MDLDRQLKFPPEIAVISSRPDIVLWSAGTKQIIMLELTVPWEERIEEAYERKMAKYQLLVEACQANGWRTYMVPASRGRLRRIHRAVFMESFPATGNQGTDKEQNCG